MHVQTPAQKRRGLLRLRSPDYGEEEDAAGVVVLAAAFLCFLAGAALVLSPDMLLSPEDMLPLDIEESLFFIESWDIDPAEAEVLE
jgi:hypothetical protein